MLFENNSRFNWPRPAHLPHRGGRPVHPASGRFLAAENTKLSVFYGKRAEKASEKIVEKYKSVIYIQNKENLGGALSRNVGIKNAKGKFIAFLDDDDKYTKDKIEKQYQCYEQHKNDKVGLIYCYCYRENEKGNIVGSYQNDYEGNRIYEQMLGCIARNIFMVLSKRCVNICWNVWRYTMQTRFNNVAKIIMQWI